MNQVESFLEATGITISIKPISFKKHFDSDEVARFVYQGVIKRGSRSMIIEYSGSLHDAELIIKANLKNYSYEGHTTEHFRYPMRVIADNNLLAEFERRLAKQDITTIKDILTYGPNAYSVLACLAKSDPGSFEDFCAEYGYDKDSRKAEKIYNAVRQEWADLQRIFNDSELLQLVEIT